MKVIIKDSTGKVICYAVAKTSRGFNKEQRERIAKARAEAQGSTYHFSSASKARGAEPTAP